MTKFTLSENDVKIVSTVHFMLRDIERTLSGMDNSKVQNAINSGIGLLEEMTKVFYTQTKVSPQEGGIILLEQEILVEPHLPDEPISIGYRDTGYVQQKLDELILGIKLLTKIGYLGY